ncbi:GNAT family N-acetyltransferase [Candidatus Sumerlaeota bacterium]|nr:GNAT family N-acetyltransferase [Candidatus Sumerlaeota bacterium]
MKNPFIIGDKIFLRAVEIEDAELLMRCNNQPEVQTTFFIAFPTNIYRQEQEIQRLYEQKDYIPFVICEKENDMAIGLTAFHRVDLVSRAAVFSIRIAYEEVWGKGYGSEATRLMVEYGFEKLNLNRIQLHVFSGNTRGIRAYEKAGFVKEGLLRQAMYHNDEYCDFLVMGILRKEYYEQKKKK